MNAANQIVHLHVHSEKGSLLDGKSKIHEIVSRAKEIGSPAIAITDHGMCNAIPDFIAKCKEEKIKPIPGCEVYHTKNRLVKSEELRTLREKICIKYKITDSKGKPKMKALQDFIKKIKKDHTVFEQEAYLLLRDYLMGTEIDLFSFEELEETTEEKIEKFKKDIYNYLDHGNFHLLLLAMNNQGLKDLYKIVSDAHINGFYSDPRTDLQYIKENNLGKNIIATSACLGSYLAHLCFSGRIEEAKEFIQECKETFHSFYLEKQATDVPEQQIYNKMIDQLAAETNTPKVVTTDVHFARKEDHEIHDVVVAASMNKCVYDEDRYHYSKDHYIKSIEEIRETFNDEEAIANTLKIAEMIDVDLPEKPVFPTFIIEGDETAEELLKKKAWNGLFQYCLKNTNIDFNKYANQMQYELDVICNLGFADYFLIDEDMINATKKAGFLVGPGRGSAAGSLVAFCIGITAVDPIKYNLLFERFLNPERASYPDIDTDFSYEGARWVQHYLKKKYGHNKVAQIGTESTLAARQSIRKFGKTLGYDKQNKDLIDQFAKAIPSEPNIKLKEAYEREEKVRQFANTYEKWWNICLELEGNVNSYGVHAGGIVISPVPLTDVVPLRLDTEGLETTQYTMEWIEKFLVKFDILKIDTLDLIKKTLEYAGLWGKIDIYNDIDINDPYIYQEVYQKLNLSGIFQCESDLFKSIISEMKPNRFDDISVIVALSYPVNRGQR